MGEFLVLNGYQVSSAEKGEDALDKLSKTAVPPALILLDLAMPKMDGCAFMRRFRPRMPKVPIVVMTADASPQVSDAAAVLNKPLKPGLLLSCLRHFLP